MLRIVKEKHPDWSDYDIISKLVGYCSGKNLNIDIIYNQFINSYEYYFIMYGEIITYCSYKKEHKI